MLCNVRVSCTPYLFPDDGREIVTVTDEPLAPAALAYICLYRLTYGVTVFSVVTHLQV